MGFEYIGLFISVILLGFLYSTYSSIIRNKNQARESLSDIDVQLKKRSDLIPNILTIAKKFMEHESELFTKVTELRSKADSPYDKDDANAVKEHLASMGQLDQHLGKLMVSVEAYPMLKSDQTMVNAQVTYNEVEEHIAAARRFYNSSVAALNNSIEIFPGNLLAGICGAKTMPFYEADESARAPVDATKFL